VARDPADGAQKGDGAETDADVAVGHAPEFGVGPGGGEIVECFKRNEEITRAFEDECVFEV